MIVLSEVWSSSQACCDFSESRSACRRARSFSIAMMSPSFCARESSASICWMLRSPARTRASLSITLVVTSSDFWLRCSTSPSVPKASIASSKWSLGTRSVIVLSDEAAVVVAARSARRRPTPPHDETSRIDLGRGPWSGPSRAA